MAQHGLCLGDVTGDGDHELVVGTDGGDLLVFKGAGGQVWRRGQDMGFITAVGMGDLPGMVRHTSSARTGRQSGSSLRKVSPPSPRVCTP